MLLKAFYVIVSKKSPLEINKEVKNGNDKG